MALTPEEYAEREAAVEEAAAELENLLVDKTLRPGILAAARWMAANKDEGTFRRLGQHLAYKISKYDELNKVAA